MYIIRNLAIYQIEYSNPLIFFMQRNISCGELDSLNKFEANFCCCFLPSTIATLNIYASYDNGESLVLQNGGGFVRKLFSEVKNLNINSSTRIWCAIIDYSNSSNTTCNHYIYTNNCQSTGILLSPCIFN